MYVFFILSVKVGYGVISYVTDKRVWVCRTTAEEFISQMVYEIPEERNV
jgi:hypothetical protein